MLKYMERHLGMKFDFALLTPFPDENLFDKENEEMIEKDLEWDVDLNTQNRVITEKKIYVFSRQKLKPLIKVIFNPHRQNESENQSKVSFSEPYFPYELYQTLFVHTHITPSAAHFRFENSTDVN